MPRRAATAFSAPKPSDVAPTKNLQGYPAYERSLEEQFLQTCLTNTFGSAYYAEQKALIGEAQQIHTSMLKKDPDFYAKGLVYARNKGFMRAQPVYGLSLLAQSDGDLFAETFPKIIRTPNDLRDFASIVKSLRNGEGGRKIKRVAGQWLAKSLSEYWAIKYGAEREDGSYSLRDLLATFHPQGEPVEWADKQFSYTRAKKASSTGTAKPRSNFKLVSAVDDESGNVTITGLTKQVTKRASLPLLDYLLRDDFEVPETLKQVRAFEALKKATTDDEKIKYIVEGRLPHEVATSFAGTSKAVWKAIVPNMPIFAMLRNLSTMERQGVMDEVRDQVVALLSNEKAVAKSKILPFRFVEAMKHVRDAKVQDALRDAVDLSFANVPDIEGSLYVAEDISGSMAAYCQTAALFAIAALKKAKGNGDFVLFDDRLEEMRVSMRDSILTQAAKIRTRGGTNTQLAALWLLEKRKKYDNLLLITDEQQNMGVPFMNSIAQYRQSYARDAKLFILNVAPYTHGQIVPNDPNTYFVFGWSDQALAFISYASRGWGTFVEAVRKGGAASEQNSEE